MNFPKRTISLLVGAILTTGLIAGCGGSDSATSTEDAQTVLDRVFSSDAQVDSGVLDLSFAVDAPGDQGGSIDASLSGPFQSNGDTALPEIQLTATADGSGGGTTFSFDGGLTLTGDGAWIGYQGTDYELDAATFDFLKQAFEQSAAQQTSSGQSATAVFDQFGVDPSGWLTDPTNEGTEDLDGTSVVHISGTVDVAKIVDDLSSIASQTGQAPPISSTDLDTLTSAVSDATIDVYAGADDDILRKLTLSVDLTQPAGQSGPESVAIDFSVGISGVNEDQSISGPTDAKPLSDLLGQLGISPDALGQLGALGALGGSSTGGSAAAGATSQAYLDCVAGATTPEDIQACAGQL